MSYPPPSFRTSPRAILAALLATALLPGAARAATVLNFATQWPTAITNSNKAYEETPAMSGVWSIPNVAPGIDATLTLTGFTGTGGTIQTVTLDSTTYQSAFGETGSPSQYGAALALAFRAVSTTAAGVNFRLTFSQPVTTTFAVLDMDTATPATSGLQEILGLKTSQFDAVRPGSSVADLGVTGDYHRFGGSVLPEHDNVSITNFALQQPVTVEFDVTNATTLDFTWNITRTDAGGTNNRIFYLASIPEPGTASLGLLAALGLLRRRR